MLLWGGGCHVVRYMLIWRQTKLVNILSKNHSIHSKELKDHIHLLKSLYLFSRLVKLSCGFNGKVTVSSHFNLINFKQNFLLCLPEYIQNIFIIKNSIKCFSINDRLNLDIAFSGTSFYWKLAFSQFWWLH